ncbi:hypothetical protein E6O75_ATG01709 [Venturia nashicola]|uniref:Uncharacterized protein n=1 Tax=Venturia nashicola TaxID=86259 RepID=A0A4Z1NEB1_9PEZI|nr:hypothetical protein E6O75_ATG01709 [Venturia nashicola]
MDASPRFNAGGSAFVLNLSDGLMRAETLFDMAGRRTQSTVMTGDFEDNHEREQLQDKRLNEARNICVDSGDRGESTLDASHELSGAGVGLDMVDRTRRNNLEDPGFDEDLENNGEEGHTNTQQSDVAAVEEVTTVVDDFADRVPVSGGERTTGDWTNDHDEMAERLWYLRDQEALGPRVPLPNHKVMMKDLPPRKLALYRRSGHSCKDIMRIIQDAPALPTGLSNRVQRYFAWEGMESESKGQRRSLTAEAIRGLMKLSNAKIFYGVRGKVKRGEYEMTEPDDAFQGTYARNSGGCRVQKVQQGTYARSSTRVPLQAPKDVEWWLRQALMDAGIKNFPTFVEFLLRNPDIAQHWGLDPMTGRPRGYVQPVIPAKSKARSKLKAQKAKQDLPLDAQATPPVGQSFVQHSSAKTTQALPTKSLSRKREAEDNTQPASDRSKKPKLMNAVSETQEELQSVQRALRQQQTNECFDEEVQDGAEPSSDPYNFLHGYEEFLLNPYPEQPIVYGQHFGVPDLQYPEHEFSVSTSSQYDSAYAHNSAASPD